MVSYFHCPKRCLILPHRFSSHGTSRETRRLAPEILSLKKTTKGESGADVWWDFYGKACYTAQLDWLFVSLGIFKVVLISLFLCVYTHVCLSNSTREHKSRCVSFPHVGSEDWARSSGLVAKVPLDTEFCGCQFFLDRVLLCGWVRRGNDCADQIVLKLAVTVLLHPLECWDYRHELPWFFSFFFSPNNLF